MLSKYIEKWLNVIDEMQNDNTYKLSFGRALIENLVFSNYTETENTIIISFDSISECMLRYYWNQIFYFNLKQAPYAKKQPVICKDTHALIEYYKGITDSPIPKWFDDAVSEIKKHSAETYSKTIKHISKTLHENVCWRFKIINGVEIDLYEYTPKEPYIIFRKDDAAILKEYASIISKLLNYKWAQLLEKFNFAPKIANKVIGISETKLKRNNLSKYREVLLREHDGMAIDFYTGKELSHDDISIDHVIPWSFMYSDDIWNLVITSKSNNSAKSDSIPNQEIIERLKKRNLRLLKILDGSFRDDLELAIKNNYLDRFYYDCKL